MLSIIATSLGPATRTIFASTTYLCLRSFYATALAPPMRMLSYYCHVSMLVFFHVSVCSLLLSCVRTFYSVRCGSKELYKQ